MPVSTPLLPEDLRRAGGGVQGQTRVAVLLMADGEWQEAMGGEGNYDAPTGRVSALTAD